MLTLSIKEACHEQWNEMTPVQQGVYCGSCCREVVDFTAFTDQELLDYMQQKKGQAGCGKFRNDQLNRPIIAIPPAVLQMDIPLWKKFLALVFICFAAFITGCNSDKQPLDKLDLDIVQAAPIKNNAIVVNSPEPVTTIAATELQEPKQKKKKPKGKTQTAILVESIDCSTMGLFAPTYHMSTGTYRLPDAPEPLDRIPGPIPIKNIKE